MDNDNIEPLIAAPSEPQSPTPPVQTAQVASPSIPILPDGNGKEPEEPQDDGERDEDEEYGFGLEHVKIPRILTYDEIDRFLLAIDDFDDMLAARLMLFGGLRVNEAVNLNIDDINFETPGVIVRRAKSKADRWVPLDIHTITLLKCLLKLRKLPRSAKLFDCSKRTIQRHMDALYEKAGIHGAVVHTLRHTCATWQLDKGISLEEIRASLGHTNIEFTQNYLHLNIRQRSSSYRDAVRFGI